MNARPQTQASSVQQLRSNIVHIAQQEYARWNPQGRRQTETQPHMLPILQDYWRRGTGVSFSLEQLSDSKFQKNYPWSSAFISWVMRQAGAGSAFAYNPTHTIYVAAAKRNRLTNAPNPFYAYRPSEVVPEPGDLICWIRAKNGLTYDTVRNQASHSDIVVAKRPGGLTLVGGNVNDSVDIKPLAIGPDGRVRDPLVYAIVKLVDVQGATIAGRSSLPSNPTEPRAAGSQPGAVRPAQSIPAQSVPATPRAVPQGTAGSSLIESRTMYLPIALGARNSNGSPAPNLTGVYLPRSFSPSGAWDILLYLHGHKGQAYTRSIREIWNAQQGRQSALREAVEQSGRNLLFIAPTLGNQSNAGWLASPGGLDRFLQQVIPSVANRFGLNHTPSVGRVTLACHSGGGSPMLAIATGQNNTSRLVQECWGFDCMYNSGSDRAWAQWADNHSMSTLFIYYLGGTQTARLSESLAAMRRPNVEVIRSTAGSHGLVPVHHLPERLAGRRR
jgi:hypothetical protein